MPQDFSFFSNFVSAMQGERAQKRQLAMDMARQHYEAADLALRERQAAATEGQRAALLALATRREDNKEKEQTLGDALKARNINSQIAAREARTELGQENFGLGQQRFGLAQRIADAVTLPLGMARIGDVNADAELKRKEAQAIAGRSALVQTEIDRNQEKLKEDKGLFAGKQKLQALDIQKGIKTLKEIDARSLLYGAEIAKAKAETDLVQLNAQFERKYGNKEGRPITDPERADLHIMFTSASANVRQFQTQVEVAEKDHEKYQADADTLTQRYQELITDPNVVSHITPNTPLQVGSQGYNSWDAFKEAYVKSADLAIRSGMMVEALKKELTTAQAQQTQIGAMLNAKGQKTDATGGKASTGNTKVVKTPKSPQTHADRAHATVQRHTSAINAGLQRQGAAAGRAQRRVNALPGMSGTRSQHHGTPPDMSHMSNEDLLKMMSGGR